MRRTRRSPAVRGEGRRFDGVETARDSGRRAGRGGVTAPALLREQIGQFASMRLWRQKVGTHPQSRTGGPTGGSECRAALAAVSGGARGAGSSLLRRAAGPYLWQERARLRCTTV